MKIDIAYSSEEEKECKELVDALYELFEDYSIRIKETPAKKWYAHTYMSIREYQDYPKR